MVIDTHVLLWWLTDTEKLSATARDFMNRCESGEDRCVISGVSLWELEHKRRKGSLPLSHPIRTWLPKLQELEFVEVTGASAELWLSAAELTWAHRDPADRLIAATALARGVALLTKDSLFHTSDSPVKAVW
jgi:PIN domain nuclease of toxin-antitoxin system